MLPFEVLLLGFLATNSVALTISKEHHYAFPRQDVFTNEKQSQQLIPDNANYQCFGGDIGNYPAESSWLSWEDLWEVNREQVLSSNGGDIYLQHYIHEAILQVSLESDIDARLVLALTMQESRGSANVPCKGSGSILRCGILGAYEGHSFDAQRPRASVMRMMREGVQGDAKRGVGFGGYLNGRPQVAGVEPGSVFAAARAYNSGMASEDLDDAKSQGEPGYSNDVANRLLGWDGRGKPFKKCR